MVTGAVNLLLPTVGVVVMGGVKPVTVGVMVEGVMVEGVT